MNVWHGFLMGVREHPFPHTWDCQAQNIATWPVLSPLASRKREMKVLAHSPPGPGQAGTAVPIHSAHGAVQGGFLRETRP